MQYLGNVIFQLRLEKVIMKQTYRNLIAWHQIFKQLFEPHTVLKS